jgi:solute carrier family 45 protein 1/2/4
MEIASPYLLSLGLSKSYMSLVFLAGPLSGLLVQPVIGR